MSNHGIKASASNLVTSICLGLRLMTTRERRVATVLLATSLFNGLLQTVTIVAIVPVVLSIVDSSHSLSGRFLPWIESLFGSSDHNIFLLRLTCALAALVVVRGLFSWFQLGWMSHFSAGCEVRLSSFLVKRILMAPYSWLVRQNSSRLRQLLFGFATLWSRDFIRTLMKLINDLVLVSFIVAVLIWADPVSGMIVAVGVSLLGMTIFMVVRPKLLRLAETKRLGSLGASSVSTEAILGVKEVKIAGAEDRFSSLFVDKVEEYAMADAENQQWSLLPRHVLEFLSYGSLIGLSVAVVLSEVRSAEMAGLILLYGFSAIRVVPMFSTVVSGFATLLNSFPIIAELDQLIIATQTAETGDSAGPTFMSWKEVHLSNISFHYQVHDRPVIDGVSISIVRGGSYGVVGPSGAGKSTLIDLIAGLLEPTSGAVTVDGRPLAAMDRVAWRQRFGYVAQRPFLLDASLRENIMFNSASAIDEDRFQRAIVLARLEKVVDRLFGGIDGRVGEQGAFLSGGERQRVAIARALYRGADLLVLDEATSALDPLVEQEINESIAALYGQVTTIVVSHRIGLVRHCDEIWVFEEGGLAAHGTHEELLRSSYLYHQMTRQSARGAYGRSMVLPDFDHPIAAPPDNL